MKRKLSSFCLFILCLSAVMTLGVSAEVSTSDKIEHKENMIYVAGNDDFFPVEYYDEEAEAYRGVMPSILEKVSDNTDYNFVYVRNGMSRTDLSADLQVEIVSACAGDEKKLNVLKSVPVFSYMQGNDRIQVNWGFTEIADEDLISIMSAIAEGLTQEEINGYFVSLGVEPQKNNYTQGIIVGSIVFILMLAVFLITLKKAKNKLTAQRMTDSDTGIGNLLYFENAFHKIITNESRSLYRIAYIVIDSNYLQVYHGEAIFKDAIRFTANKLEEYDRDSDFVARISENGFAVAFLAINDNEAKRKLEGIINKLNGYIDITDKYDKHYYSAAVYSLKKSDKNSDLLLYNLRKKCNEIMDSEQQIVYLDNSTMESISEEKDLLENILTGLEKNEFKLYIQFIVNNKTGKIVSAEALSRWDSSKLGMVSPGKYITALENSGYISRLDYYMFETCCRQLHKWNSTELGEISLSCNITRTTLSEIDFLEKIKEISEGYVFDKHKLVIEITEETIEKSFDRATENVRGCKKLGFGISLDDLGTGYTTFSNMCDYPIDIVKIDKEILLKTDSESGQGLFTGIISLAHNLKIKVVCEGVETEEQKEFVRNTDCDMVQGWYYSHVFPVREGEEFAKDKLQ